MCANKVKSAMHDAQFDREAFATRRGGKVNSRHGSFRHSDSRTVEVLLQTEIELVQTA